MEVTEDKTLEKEITVTINGEKVVLKGKQSYILVDILDVYPFDLSTATTSHLITKVNEKVADFTTSLSDNDIIDMYWEE